MGSLVSFYLYTTAALITSSPRKENVFISERSHATFFTQGCAAEWMSDYTTRNTSFCLPSNSEGNYSTYHQELLSFVLCACSGTLSDVQVY